MISGPVISPDAAAQLVGQAVFLDARAGAGARQQYSEAHVAGAFHADLEEDLSSIDDPAQGGRHPLPPLDEWLARLGTWGIAPRTPVVIYDASSGGMAAARAWWMLDAVGHRQVAVVYGGYSALQSSRVATTGDAPTLAGAPSYPAAIAEWPSVDARFVERVRIDPAWRVIDARAPERFAGEAEPIDPVAGHIPGARSLYWRSQLDDSGRLLDRSRLRARYRDVLEEVSPDRVVCYCGSGVTACHLLWAMRVCGLDGAALYVGSWSEWCRQNRPRGKSG